MEKCRDAVPVWIMPLSRVVENFDFSDRRFDVVIIDEASQCDIMALVAFALSEKVVIVGDDKQVSPSATGQALDDVDALIRQYLQGIPNAELFDGRYSIYAAAKAAFEGGICLTEHFRCVPDIIQFSNKLCYYPENELKPLREPASSPLLPHVVPFRVEGALREVGMINPEEAKAVASLIAAACEHEAYKKQTFGVVSLLGDQQALLIEQMVRKHIPPDECDRRHLLCGNAAQFQGDERDVMFLTMVDSPGDGPLRLLKDQMFEQRYNVAASRARNQMWVVYSLNPSTDLKDGDLRLRLIQHALDPRAIERQLAQGLERVESPFEKEVFDRLVRASYRVHSQWPVGAYRIDFVVEYSDGEKLLRMAIECDGDRYHPIEKLRDDMERQAILERLGWRFIRIRGSEYYRNRNATMERVFRILTDADILPQGPELQESESAQGQQLLKDSIVRRAAEIRAEWLQLEVDDEQDVTQRHELLVASSTTC